jgi:hypothetical protein
MLLTMLMSLMTTMDIERWEPRVGCWLLKNSMCPVIEGVVHFTLLFDGHSNTHNLLLLLPCCVHAATPWSEHLIGQARMRDGRINMWTKKNSFTAINTW